MKYHILFAYFSLGLLTHIIFLLQVLIVKLEDWSGKFKLQIV
jgi:hypothetical protein